MDSCADDGAAFGEDGERRRDEPADRSEDDRRIELLGWALVGAARPLGPELSRERLPLGVSRLREGEDSASLVTRDLRDDVRRRAEAVQADPLGVAGEAKRAVADQAGAEER